MENGHVRNAVGILKHALGEFGEDVAIACSFGKDSVTVLHLARQLRPDVRVLYVNTGLDFPETLEFRDRLVDDWRINLQEFRPTPENVDTRNSLDPNLNASNPDLCCDLLKVEPTERSLEGLRAWVVGLRRDETAFRQDLEPYEEQERSDGSPLIRVAPLYNWTERDVWEYIRSNDVPYHPAYDQGYRSMGCMPCSKAGQWGRFERAGRWPDSSKEECGIHTFLRKRSNFVEVSQVVAGPEADREDLR